MEAKAIAIYRLYGTVFLVNDRAEIKVVHTLKALKEELLKGIWIDAK